MFSKYKLVQFYDGCFGVRKRVGFLSFKFLDFKNRAYWWDTTATYFPDCKTNELEARVAFNDLRYKYKVIA